MYFNYEPYAVVFYESEYKKSGRNYYAFHTDDINSEIHIGHDNIHSYEVLHRIHTDFTMVNVRVAWDCHERIICIMCSLSNGEGWLPEYETTVRVPDYMTDEEYFQQSLLHYIPITNKSINNIINFLREAADHHRQQKDYTQ